MTKPPPGDVVLLVLCHHTKLWRKKRENMFFQTNYARIKETLQNTGNATFTICHTVGTE